MVQHLPKSKFECINQYSGLIPKRVVDRCFADLLTGDLMKEVHQQKVQERFEAVNATMNQANDRSLVSKLGTVLSEKRKSSLVP